MATTPRRLLRSFAGGIVAPEMFGRIDLDKMQTGLADAENFRILPHGPAQNRAGFRYVIEVKDSAKRVRVIPFVYSATQTAVLEVGEGYVRVHTQGATVLNAAQSVTAMTQAFPGVLTYAGADPTAGTVVFLSGMDGTPQLESRFVKVGTVDTVAKTFTLKDMAGNSIDTRGYGSYVSGGTFASIYEFADPWAEGDLFDLHYTQSADVLSVMHPGYAPREIRRAGATSWSTSTITIGPTIAAPASTTAVDGGPGGGTTTSYRYKTTAVSADGFEESVASPASSAIDIDLSVAGNYVDVTPAAVAGAVRYNVYKRVTGGLYGYIGQTTGASFRDQNITPDMTQTPPESTDPFSGAGNYPSTVNYIEQRRVFAGTENKPQMVFMTRSATESNFTQSIPLRDDDAIFLPAKVAQQNRIRHVVPLSDLIALTVGGALRIYSAGGDVLTPATAAPKLISTVGSSNVQPVVAENAVLYAQVSGGHVRELAYAGDGLNGASFVSNDVSVLAPHLFDGHTVVDMAFSTTSSCPICWIVRDDGQLLGMTYVPGQNVRAWHRHTTDGTFESVACVIEDGEDVLYVVVKRSINGRDVRYIERLETRLFTDQADAFHVDSGLSYRGDPTTTITGLWHLEGEDVVALADGAVVEGLTVQGGGVTLPVEASVVHVGLAYTSTLKTLPLSYQNDEAAGQGVVKNVNEVHIRVHDSGAMHVGPTDGRLVEAKRRTTEPYGTAPRLRTGWDHVNVTPRWEDDGGITVEMRSPLPLTVLAMVISATAGN